MSTATVDFVANLAIGKEGADRIYSALTEEQKPEYSQQLGQHIVDEVTNPMTVVCMEDRPDVDFADGTTDPAALRERAYFQWPGGLYLATTKAAVAANAAYLRDATSFKDAYLLTAQVLGAMGYEDGGHAGCGASGKVKASVEVPVARELALPTIGAIIEVNQSRTDLFDKNAANKQRKLEDGFFDGWTQAWHEEYLEKNVPHNYSHIKTEADAVHGHKAKSLLVVTEKGKAFAKNAFYQDTNDMSFGVTPPAVIEIAHKLGGTPEEREALVVGFMTDLLDVSDKLIAPGMPTFAQAA